MIKAALMFEFASFIPKNVRAMSLKKQQIYYKGYDYENIIDSIIAKMDKPVCFPIVPTVGMKVFLLSFKKQLGLSDEEIDFLETEDTYYTISDITIASDYIEVWFDVDEA